MAKERRFTFVAYRKLAFALDAACAKVRLSASEYCRRAVIKQIEADGISLEPKKPPTWQAKAMAFIKLDQACLQAGIDIGSDRAITEEQARAALLNAIERTKRGSSR